MAVITNITNLSQTASLNGPDGAVDPPSTLDDQDRYLGSFIAMLRDGVNFTAGALVASLGFTPVRQGTGAGQIANTVSIGWSAGGKLLVSVDNNAFGDIWPIVADTATGVRSGGTVAGTKMVFNWSDPGGASPAYLFCGNSPSDLFVRPPSALTVGLATNANNAYGCSGNAATASNASAVNGISGWAYRNDANNPAYLWCSEGSGTAQHLTQPGSLSVNYANSAGSAPANGGTSSNSNALAGQGVGYFVNNAGSAVVNLRNNATIQMLCGVSGIGDMYWGASVSDERLKKDIAPTIVDSLEQISRIRFVGFNWRDNLDFEIGDRTFNPVAVIAQEAEKIEPKWISNAGTWKQPDLYPMLMSAMHAIQQLAVQVKALQAKLS